jgi:hypothetical protein
MALPAATKRKIIYPMCIACCFPLLVLLTRLTRENGAACMLVPRHTSTGKAQTHSQHAGDALFLEAHSVLTAVCILPRSLARKNGIGCRGGEKSLSPTHCFITAGLQARTGGTKLRLGESVDDAYVIDGSGGRSTSRARACILAESSVAKPFARHGRCHVQCAERSHATTTGQSATGGGRTFGPRDRCRVLSSSRRSAAHDVSRKLSVTPQGMRGVGGDFDHSSSFCGSWSRSATYAREMERRR